MTKSASVKITLNSVSNESNESHENPEVIISSFEVYPDEIYLGESAYLSWVITGATSVSINIGIGFVALTENRMIQPTKTTTYVLTASNAVTNKQATVMIYVQSKQNPPLSTPNIACTTDSMTNKLTIPTADAGIKWDDIVITTDPVVNWALYTDRGIVNQTTNAYPNNSTVTVIAGDYLHLYGVGVGNVRVTLRYESTNSLLCIWTINV
jgi:hypothetical protein